MKIVIDANVIISAFAGRGLCSEVFELCLSDHDITLSEDLIMEVQRGLLKKIKVPEHTVKNIIEFLRLKTIIVAPAKIDDTICRDKDDQIVFGTALAAQVTVIITGDKDLLVLKQYKHIKILTPRAFWMLLKSRR